MNYFEWFGLPQNTNLDIQLLRQAYLRLSRSFHPDFVTLQSDLTQEEALEKSAFNNLAYQTLLQPASRLRYLLEIGGHWQTSAKVSADFLMEMMELNELKLDPDQQLRFQQQLTALEAQLAADFETLLATFDGQTATSAQWQALNDYYQRFLYLDKIKK